MRSPSSRKPTANDFASAARDALARGRPEVAHGLFREALRFAARDGEILVALAYASEAAGEIDRAAAELTQAIRLLPDYVPAIRALSRLAARYEIDDTNGLDATGLMIALRTPRVGVDSIAALCRRHVVAGDGELIRLLARPAADLDAAGAAAAIRLTKGLRHHLFHTALAAGLIRDGALERLLTGVRRAMLLDPAAAPLGDRGRLELALALLAQAWRNDHAWFEGDEEVAALSRLGVDRAALLAGDTSAGEALLKRLLYRPLAEALPGGLSPDEAGHVRPKLLRDLLVAHVGEAADEARRRRTLQRLAPITDATALKVKGQYETAPYPRWTSLQLPAPMSLTTALSRLRPAAELEFLTRPFDVLIAGCGTGQHAIATTAGYGPSARVLGLDLSAASLAYAARKADELGIGNLSLAQGDLSEIRALGRTFDIIEAVGVLHHMADPWAGWRALLDVLASHGLMYVGLYSRTARRDIAALRADPATPLPGSSDGEARRFRRRLLDAAPEAAGHGLAGSRNFWSLNEFRDLVLHESEVTTTLSEIAGFLSANRLEVLDVTLPAAARAAFADEQPDADPRDLTAWDAFENRHPDAFAGMYCLWVGRRGAGA